jgi:hypothetical protein
MKAAWFGFFLICSCRSNSEPVAVETQACAESATSRLADICHYDALLATDPADPAAALNHAQEIGDPIIRGAAILKWVQVHNRQIQADEGRKLCRLLGDRERTACERRLYSAHLQR